MMGSFDSIPILDLNPITTVFSEHEKNPEIWESLARELRRSPGNVGFLQVVNHGIPEDLVEKVFSVSEKFFSLPPEVKMKYYRPEFTGIDSRFGYSKERESFGEVKEFRESYDWLLDQGIYPTEEDGLEDYYSSLLSLSSHFQSVAKTVLRLVSISIGLEADHLLQHFKYFEDPKRFKAIHNLRIAHYPRLKKSSSESENSPLIGIAEHTDVDVISLLLQNQVSGLEVKTTQGHWIPVTPIKGAIVVNVGDVLEFWTRGLYRATPHRVLIPQLLVSDPSLSSPRYSIGAFYGPDIPTILRPIKDIPNLTPEEENRMKEHTQGRFQLLEDGVSCNVTDHILNKLTQYINNAN